MKKNKFVLLVLLLGALILSSCKKAVGTEEDNAAPVSQDEVEMVTGYTFGFSSMTMDNPYFTTLEASLREELEAAENTLITKDPQMDHEQQIIQIEEMISEGVDAVFLCPVDWEEIKPALQKLRAAKVKIINIDTRVKDGEYVDAYIGSDNKMAGYLCAVDLIKRCPDGGKVVILESMNINSISERITGFEEELAQAENGFTISVRREVDGDLSRSLEAAEEIFKEEDDIAAVMCGNDQIALGALVAANALNIEEVYIYGVDGSPDLKKELEKKETLIAGTAAQSPISMGKEAAKLGLAILNGDSYEDETYSDVFFIDQSNIEMYGADGWQ